MCEIDIGNPKTRKTLRLLSSGTKPFITFELKVFRHEERETQSFYADCFYIVSSQPNQRAAHVAHKVGWPRPGLDVDSLIRRQELNSVLFLKSQPTLPVHDFTHIPWSQFLPGIFILTSLNDTSSSRVWTPALMLHLTNPWAKRKVLSLTKPKGKIYKTKFLRNYIMFASGPIQYE